MRLGFWTGGASSYREQLDQQEAERLGELRSALRAATDPTQKEQIKVAIVQTTSEFRRKRRATKASLFGIG